MPANINASRIRLIDPPVLADFYNGYIRNRGGRKLSARDGRHDGDLGAVGDRRLKVFQKPNVFTIQVDINEAPQTAFFVTDAGANTRIFRVQIVEYLLYSPGFNLNGFRAGREFSKGSGNDDLKRHDTHLQILPRTLKVSVRSPVEAPGPEPLAFSGHFQ